VEQDLKKSNEGMLRACGFLRTRKITNRDVESTLLRGALSARDANARKREETGRLHGEIFVRKVLQGEWRGKAVTQGGRGNSGIG